MHQEEVKAILSRHGIEITPELLTAIQEILKQSEHSSKSKNAYDEKRKNRMNGIK